MAVADETIQSLRVWIMGDVRRNPVRKFYLYPSCHIGTHLGPRSFEMYSLEIKNLRLHFPQLLNSFEPSDLE